MLGSVNQLVVYGAYRYDPMQAYLAHRWDLLSARAAALREACALTERAPAIQEQMRRIGEARVAIEHACEDVITSRP